MSDEYTDPSFRQPGDEFDAEREAWNEFLVERDLSAGDRAIELGGMPGQLREPWDIEEAA